MNSAVENKNLKPPASAAGQHLSVAAAITAVGGDILSATMAAASVTGSRTKSATPMSTLAPPPSPASNSSGASASAASGDFRLQVDYSWSRSLSERVRGMRDSALSIVWKKRREQKLREIEARDACFWLLAAGFPQYVQLYEEHKCPIDMRQVEEDHASIDKAYLQSVFRRIDVLNRLTCCKATETIVQIKPGDVEDNDRCVCLSDRWRYFVNHSSPVGRWIRIDPDGVCGSSTGQHLGDSCIGLDYSPSPPTVGRHQPSTVEPNRKHKHRKHNAAGGRVSRESSREMSPSIVVSSCDGDSTALPVSSATGNSGVSSEFVRGSSERFSLRSAKNMLRRGVDNLMNRRPSSSCISSSSPSTSSHRKRMSTSSVSGSSGRPDIGDPIPPNSVEFCEKMERLGCVDVRTLATAVKKNEPDAVAGRSNSGTCSGGANGIPRAMSSDSLVDVFHRLALVADCASASVVPFQTDLQLPVDDDIRIKKCHNDGVNEVISKSADVITVTRRNSVKRNHRVLPDVVVDARVTSSEDVDPEQLAVWSRYFDVCFCECRIPPEIGSCRTGSWPWCSSSAHGSESTGGGGDIIDDSRQSELDRILVELDRDITLLDQSLDAQESAAGGSEDSAEPNVAGHPEDDAAAASAVNSGDISWQFIRPVVDRPPLAEDTMMSCAHTDFTVQQFPNSESPDVLRDRRDSGVGFSLTRRESKPQKSRGSDDFFRSLQCNGYCCERHPDHMTSAQLTLLRKLSLLHVTSVIETYSPLHQTGSNWTAPRPSTIPSAVSTPERGRGSSGGNRGASGHSNSGGGSGSRRRNVVFGASLGWNGWDQLQQHQHPGESMTASTCSSSSSSGNGGLGACPGTLPLPACILRAMRFLLAGSGSDTVGIFRKSGVRSRIQKLREEVEADPESIDFSNQPVHDVADVLKLYFHELPECLLTDKLSETCISIFTHVPVEARMSALKSVLLLLPDENRDALCCLLRFLNILSQHASLHQMTASNLAICYAPSLFHIYGLRLPATQSGSGAGSGGSPRRDTKHSSQSSGSGFPDESDMAEQRAAHDCLTVMIADYMELFTVADDVALIQRRLSSSQQSGPNPSQTINAPQPDGAATTNKSETITTTSTTSPTTTTTSPSPKTSTKRCNSDRSASYRSLIQGCLNVAIVESQDTNVTKGWIAVKPYSAGDVTVDLSYKMAFDDSTPSPSPPRLWRCRAEVDGASAPEILSRLVDEFHVFDDRITRWRVVQRLEDHVDIFHYVATYFDDIIGFGCHPYQRSSVDFCELRCWKCDDQTGKCLLVSVSVDHPDVAPFAGSVRAPKLESYYILEDLGPKRCQVIHISRVDFRGRSLEWYRKFYGYTCAHRVIQMGKYFRSLKTENVEDGREVAIS